MKNIKLILASGITVQVLLLSSVSQGALKPCPEKPNCVSSQETGKHHTEPFRVSDFNRISVIQALKASMSEISRSTLVNESAGYLHYEVKTAVFRFTDDVEFEISDSDQVVHVRSASRTGYYDFNKNKSRVQKIRALFQKKLTEKEQKS